MKISILILFSTLTFLMSAQQTKINNIYYDEDNNIISKNSFTTLLGDHEVYLDVALDEPHKHKLIRREVHGKLQNHHEFINKLQSQINSTIDTTKPIVIIYTPANPEYLGSIKETRRFHKSWHEDLEKLLLKKYKIKPIYICKNRETVAFLDDITPHILDSDHMIETMFFPHEINQSSFVVLSPKGNYVSYLSEFTKEYVLAAVHLMLK